MYNTFMKNVVFFSAPSMSFFVITVDEDIFIGHTLCKTYYVVFIRQSWVVCQRHIMQCYCFLYVNRKRGYFIYGKTMWMSGWCNWWCMWSGRWGNWWCRLWKKMRGDGG